VRDKKKLSEIWRAGAKYFIYSQRLLRSVVRWECPASFQRPVNLEEIREQTRLSYCSPSKPFW
jgi:hypothetical protein